MSKKKILWHKITANALVSFFSTLGASFTLDSLLNLPVEPWYFIGVAFIVAGIQFGIAFCQAWAKAEEEENHSKICSKPNTPLAMYNKWKKRTDILSNLVLFD